MSFAALKEALKKAGYVLARAEITVAGKLARDGEQWFVITSSEQRFKLADAKSLLAESSSGESVEIPARSW